ncbi:lysophospholipid acyltransferase family protein [Paenalcaligenes niemegkensis]|uniref:lysophospholipid acyltransferase family protein n=1 Tax=Paenalcaligenes niemegkensis TaxID=2895469 RepID=UPI001EE9214D|nr:lysophospholipid acyltransferase family protein [Paenalcaligenes niemegkensis]MCQ9617480.1 lysophospholipid acyltransferase family protein [Paenalcaligenes niemegkensis]
MLLFLLRALSYLPLGFLHGCGRIVGKTVYLIPGRYRNRLRKNAAQAGYTSTSFARKSAGEIGAMIFETPKVWLRADECLAKCINPDAYIVEEALAEKRGILYLTPHLGCFEITARRLVQYGPITVMFREPRQSFLEPAMRASRDTPGLHSVPANLKGIREFVRALRRGEAIGMLPDQVPSSGDGVWQPFFGKPAYTMTLAAKLALQTKVPVVLTAGERLPRGQGWKIHYVRLQEPLPESIDAMVAVINDGMESLITRFPEQYLWSYNRYKIPPEAPAIPDHLTPH